MWTNLFYKILLYMKAYFYGVVQLGIYARNFDRGLEIWDKFKTGFFFKLTAAKFKDFFLLFPYFVSEMHELTNVETSAKFDVFFL